MFNYRAIECIKTYVEGWKISSWKINETSTEEFSICLKLVEVAAKNLWANKVNQFYAVPRNESFEKGFEREKYKII